MSADCTRNLSHIEDLQTLTTVRRRLLHGNGLCEDLIEHTGLDAECLILDNSINGLKKLRQTLACLGRDKYKFCVRHICQHFSDTGLCVCR